jgi:hypothetical protein
MPGPFIFSLLGPIDFTEAMVRNNTRDELEKIRKISMESKEEEMESEDNFQNVAVHHVLMY